MNVAWMRNIGSFLKLVPALSSVTITAGGGSDAVAQNGLTLDRSDYEPLCLSALLAVTAVAALNDGVDTAQITVSYEDSADGSNWDAYDAGPPDLAAVTLNEDGTHVLGFKCQLGGARRYVRAVITSSLSRANTDTTILTAIWVIGGSDTLPIEDVPGAVLS